MQNHQTQNIDIQVYMYMEEERKRDRGARMKDQIVKLSSTGTKLGSHILFSFFLYQQTLQNLSFTFMLSKQLQLPPPCLFGRMHYSPERSYKSIIFFFYCLNLGVCFRRTGSEKRCSNSHIYSPEGYFYSNSDIGFSTSFFQIRNSHNFLECNVFG